MEDDARVRRRCVDEVGAEFLAEFFAIKTRLRRSSHGAAGGYFIDLAANDWQKDSNTYALEAFDDWNGLCVEPNDVYWSG